jgi:hypothetical protein
MYFVVKNEIHAFTPKISVIISDLAEAATFTATYLPSTSRRPCCFCLISNEDLNNMSLTNVTLRTLKKMREAIDINQANELLIHADFNFFGSLRILIADPYVIDRIPIVKCGAIFLCNNVDRHFVLQ